MISIWNQTQIFVSHLLPDDLRTSYDKKIQRSPVLLIGGLAMTGNELNDMTDRLTHFSSFTFLTFDNINVGVEPRVEVNSIRAFDGEGVCGRIGQSNSRIFILSGDENVLFDGRHVQGIKSKLPKVQHFEFLNTGRMVHLENPSGLAFKVFEILER